jgi:hypothetical protein
LCSGFEVGNTSYNVVVEEKFKMDNDGRFSLSHIMWHQNIDQNPNSQTMCKREA